MQTSMAGRQSTIGTMHTWKRGALALMLALAALTPRAADAGCGCDKPPPPRAAIRPFVGYVDQQVTLFDDRLAPGRRYDVLFESSTGTSEWSRGRAMLRRDLADGERRMQLRVAVANVSLGPCAVSVWQDGVMLLALTDDAFTVAAAPIALHDFAEGITRDGYQTGVGRDGTMYVPVDVSRVDAATTFVGQTVGLPLHFGAGDVAMYNDQGFLMQVLKPGNTQLFRIDGGDLTRSDRLSYWRHEFATYKKDHRQRDARAVDSDTDWHVDGTYHVDHDHIVVAVRGTMPNGEPPAAGMTPAFRLSISSSTAPAGLQ
jgi:hypothetical protein